MTHSKRWSYLIFKLIYCFFINAFINQLVFAAHLNPLLLSQSSKPLFNQNVDCELNLNGRSKFDRCGVCNGDNSTCNLEEAKEHIEFVWKYVDYGECMPDCNQDEIRVDIENGGGNVDNLEDNTSNSFTIGFQTSHPLCFKRIRNLNHHSKHHSSEQVVNPDQCDQELKPSTQIRSCENFIYHCKPKWLTNEWSNCSINCGIGYQRREIYCGLISRLTKPGGKPEQVLRVDSMQCAGQSRPSIHRQCEEFDCSNWFTGPFTEVSGIFTYFFLIYLIN